MDGEPDVLLDEPVRRLLALVPAPTGARRIVGLTGLPGSGKSTLARTLARETNRVAGGNVVQVLPVDGFHLPRSRLAQWADPAAALARRGASWTFDPARLADRLQLLRAAPRAAHSPAVPWPGFDHAAGDPVEAHHLVRPSTSLVLVEGLYLLHTGHGWNLRPLLDACWYLDVDLERALARLVSRHMAAWGLSRAQAEARVRDNDRLNADMVLATRHRADWLVPG